MAKVIRIGIQDVIVTPTGKPTNIFWRALEQVFTVVTAFSDLDGNTNDISEGDINRFRQIADLVVTRDGNGRIQSLEQNGKTTTITRDAEEKITVVEEVIDAEPTKKTTQTVNRNLSERIEEIEVIVTGYPT